MCGTRDGRREGVEDGAGSWWRYPCWLCQLRELVGGSGEYVRHPLVAMWVKLSHTKEAARLHSQQAPTRNQDLAAFETVHKKKKERKKEKEGKEKDNLT